MGKSIGKNIIKNLSWKYSQKLLDHAKQSATDTLKIASKRAIQKIAEATFDLIGNKIASKIQNVLRKSRQNNLETVTNEAKVTEHDKKYLKRGIYYQKNDRK